MEFLKEVGLHAGEFNFISSRVKQIPGSGAESHEFLLLGFLCCRAVSAVSEGTTVPRSISLRTKRRTTVGLIFHAATSPAVTRSGFLALYLVLVGGQTIVTPRMRRWRRWWLMTTIVHYPRQEFLTATCHLLHSFFSRSILAWSLKLRLGVSRCIL